jgi:peptidoglycan-N-acetylglucosamine deacetylase
MKTNSAMHLVLSILMITNAPAFGQDMDQSGSVNTPTAGHETVKAAAATTNSADSLQIAMGGIGGAAFLPVPVTTLRPVPLRAIARPATVTPAAPPPATVKPQGKTATAKQTAKNKGRKQTAKSKKAKTAARKIKKEEPSPTRIICSASANKKANSDEKWVALTFDDGPSPDYTPEILALLKANGIHATFCLLGQQVKKHPDLVKQIAAEGHKIADHSLNHDLSLSWRSDKKIKQEILGEKSLLQELVPEAAVEYYRAPAGNWNYHIRKLVASWGMKPLGWSVDTHDWQQPGVDSIVNTVKTTLHSGGVILMHDAGGNRSQTVAALKKLIPYLQKEGYKFGFPD